MFITRKTMENSFSFVYSRLEDLEKDKRINERVGIDNDSLSNNIKSTNRHIDDINDKIQALLDYLNVELIDNRMAINNYSVKEKK